jgi:hypothetical protein
VKFRSDEKIENDVDDKPVIAKKSVARNRVYPYRKFKLPQIKLHLSGLDIEKP